MPAGSTTCFPATAPHYAPPSRWKRTVPAPRKAPATAKVGPAAITKPHSLNSCTQLEKRRPRRPTSLRSLSQQHNLDGLEHNQHIQTERGILDIEKIVLELL